MTKQIDRIERHSGKDELLVHLNDSLPLERFVENECFMSQMSQWVVSQWVTSEKIKVLVETIKLIIAFT